MATFYGIRAGKGNAICCGANGPGFVIVYVDNQTIGKDVWFDNISIEHYSASVIEENHYYPYGLTLISDAAGITEQPHKYNGKELEKRFGLETYEYGARQYDPQLGRWTSVDPMAHERSWVSPYNFVQNNPINRVDPTGALDDFVQDNKTGEISWDKNATSQATTKEGQTYLGKDLTFTFNSYIDKKLWDGPLGSFPAGDKLTSTINVTSNTDADNNLLSVDIKSSTFVHKTGGIFQGDGYYPGQKNINLDIKGATSGFATFEKHAKVNGFEEMGLGVMGYDKVNVAQKLTLGLNGTKLSVIGATDIFPSATLSVNGVQLFKYNQPSFKATHGRSSSYTDNGMGGVNTNDIQNKPAPTFYQRYKK